MKRAIIAIAAVVLVSAGSAGIAVGKVIYVDGGAGGADNGTCWADAYMFLQDGLADANESEKPVEVWVGQGVYRPDRTAAEPNGTGDRMATFRLINGVALKGGYAGFGEPDPNARDIELYETVLRGDLDENDIDVNDPVDLLDEPTRAENSCHVAIGSGTDETGVLDGFTITGGNANAFEAITASGGGMYNAYGSPTLLNCTFSSNSAGNDGLGGGGGMYNSGSPSVANCTFKGNSAENAGGMCCHGGSPTLNDCTFIGNSARGQGGALKIAGSPRVINCSFVNNSALIGGAIFNMDSWATLSNCVFNGNSASWWGGAWFSVDSETVLSNCTFSGNYAPKAGGIGSDSDYSLILTNSILWGNSDSSGGGESAQIHGGTPIVNYSCIQSWTGGLGGTGNISDDPLFVDPNNSDYHLQSEGWRWDTNRKVWTWDEVTSPCIDAGNPGCALGDELLSVPDDPNNEWGENLRINMGGYGGTLEASMPPYDWAILADLTNDRIVDFNDLAVFVQHWLDSGQCIPGDLSRNESVDFSDFALMGGQWLEER